MLDLGTKSCRIHLLRKDKDVPAGEQFRSRRTLKYGVIADLDKGNTEAWDKAEVAALEAFLGTVDLWKKYEI